MTPVSTGIRPVNMLLRAGEHTPFFKRARVRYNLGLALDRMERPAEAAAALEAAHRLDPRSPEFLYALVDHHAKARNWDTAVRYAKALVALDPGDQQAQRLLAALVQESKR